MNWKKSFMISKKLSVCMFFIVFVFVKIGEMPVSMCTGCAKSHVTRTHAYKFKDTEPNSLKLYKKNWSYTDKCVCKFSINFTTLMHCLFVCLSITHSNITSKSITWPNDLVLFIFSYFTPFITLLELISNHNCFSSLVSKMNNLSPPSGKVSPES